MYKLIYKILGLFTTRIRMMDGYSQKEYADLHGVEWEMIIRLESGILYNNKIHSLVVNGMNVELRFR